MIRQQASSQKSEIIIRPASLGDAQALFTLRLEALQTQPEAFAADVEMTRARGVEAWKEQISHNQSDETGVVVVAREGKELIGMCGLGRGHWPKTRHSGIIWGVYVRPAWRGKHIAHAMLDECAKWATAHGLVVLKLGVVTTNQAAIHCYQHWGFSVYGTEPKANLVDGVFYDEYLMAKLL
jgi:RimJ/RimL family protein N-acetyltransferase